MNRIDRLTSILTHLQTKRLIKAQELADRFEVSLRTIYRDIRSLEEAGVPVIGEAGYGYSLVEGYRLPPVMFTREEALSLLVAEKILEKSIDAKSSKHFSEAIIKLKAVLKVTEKDLLESIAGQVAVIKRIPENPEIKDRFLLGILQSLPDRHLVRMSYTTFEAGVTSDRTVEPVGVYYSFEQWYMIAWCRLRQDYRTFRLDRIKSLTVLSETHSSNHPSLKDYLNKVAREERLEKVRVEVPLPMTKYMNVYKYNQGFVQESQKGEMMEMVFMTGSLEGFARWLIMIADKITVVEPLSLRKMLHEISADILARNA